MTSMHSSNSGRESEFCTLESQSANGVRFSPSLMRHDSVVVCEPVSFARFRLIERVGSGGFGDVWKAWDPELDRLVAVKIPQRSLKTIAETEAFLREGRAAGRLNHLGIVTIHEVGIHEGVPFLVSNLVEGSSLHDWYRKNRPDFSRSVRVCLLLAHALEHAHNSGIIHRDLKPGNIIVDADDQPHILDFGLAKRERNEVTISIAGDVCGTPSYMSPEQAMGEGHYADRRTDIYSLGVILFELLTGRLPFSGDVTILLSKIICDDPPRPRLINPKVPRDLETICLKCLEKSPAHRYTTAGQVADDLRLFLDDVPITTRSVSRIERLGRWCRRNRIVASLVASTILLMVLTTAVSLWGFFSIRNALARESIVRQESERHNLANLNAREIAQVRDGRTNFDTGIVSAEKGIPDVAMFQMATALRHLTEAHPLVPPIRMQLSSLLETVHQLRNACRLNGRTAIGIIDGGRQCLIWEPSANDPATGTIRRLDSLTGRLSDTSLNGVSLNDQLVWNSDGKRVAAFSLGQQEIRIADFVTGTFESLGAPFSADPDSKNTTALPPGLLSNFRLRPIEFDSDGKLLAVGDSGGTIELWDVESRVLLHKLPCTESREVSAANCSVEGITFSPDGTRIAATYADDQLRIFETASGKLLGRLNTGPIFHRVLFAPDGHRIYTCAQNRSLLSWDVVTADFLECAGMLPGSPTDMQLSADGSQLLVTLSDARICVWDLKTGKTVGQELQHPGSIRCVSFGDNGNTIVIAGDEVRTWTIAHVSDDFEFVPGGRITSLAVLPGQNALLISDEGGIHRWETFANTAHESWPDVGQVDRIAVSPDGRFAASATGNEVQLWNPETGTRHFSPISHPEEVTAILFTEDGESILTGCRDGFARRYSTKSGDEIKPSFYHAGDIHDMAIYVRKQKLLTAGSAGRVRVWDLDSHSSDDVEIRLDQEVVAIAPCRQGKKILVGSTDSIAQYYSIVTGETSDFRMLHQAPLRAVATSRVGSEISATSTSKGIVQIWQWVEPASRVFNSDPPISQLCFNEAGTLLFARSDRAIRVMEVPREMEGAWEELLQRFSQMLGLVMTPAGTFRVATYEELAYEQQVSSHFQTEFRP